MAKPKHDLAGWGGVVILCLVMLVFFALTKCQPGFFRDITLLP